MTDRDRRLAKLECDLNEVDLALQADRTTPAPGERGNPYSKNVARWLWQRHKDLQAQIDELRT